jgi:ABC-type phosphonate transport system ATPase subunit
MRRFLIRTSPNVIDQNKAGKRRKTLGRLGKRVMLAGKREGNTLLWETQKQMAG